MSKKPCWICDESQDKTINIDDYTLEQLRGLLGFKMCDQHQEQVEGAIILAGGEPERSNTLPEIESDIKCTTTKE